MRKRTMNAFHLLNSIALKFTTSNNSFNRTLWQTERSHNMSFASCEQKQQQQTFQRVSSLDEISLIVRRPPFIKSNGKTSDVSASSKDNCPRHN